MVKNIFYDSDVQLDISDAIGFCSHKHGVCCRNGSRFSQVWSQGQKDLVTSKPWLLRSRRDLEAAAAGVRRPRRLWRSSLLLATLTPCTSTPGT